MTGKIMGLKLLRKVKPTKKICIMGIGNYDRADDYVGSAVIESLEQKTFPENIKLINAGPVPEAVTAVIKRFEPDYLIIVDAAQMDEEPGTIRIFSEKNVDSAYMITPHKVSMKMYTQYLKHFLKNLKTVFIGIQPKSLRYNEGMTESVKLSADFISEMLEDMLLRK
ncbi:MAG: hydrogenase 3 maturation endopeptidase HyCI [Asgard group archaeon]|nr:hydrogenase 3 maturation endopeptidase HyCI [Asgard group archaeon]